MIVARVVGNVWATRKHPALKGKRLLLVKPVDPVSGAALGDAQMAVDGGVQAGPGDVVLVLDEGGSARAIMKDETAPVRAVVCAVVDQVVSGGSVQKHA